MLDAPSRSIVLEPNQHNDGDVRGLEVSLGSLCQYQLIQCEIGNSFAKLFVFLMQPLQLFELIRPHAAVLLPPAIIRLLRNLNLSYRINPRLALPNKDINLAQLRDNLFRLCRFVAIFDPPKTKIFGGPIQWGTIILRSLQTLQLMSLG